MTYAEKLRSFADYLDKHPSVSAKIEDRWNYPSLWIGAEDWDEFQELIADLGGYRKDGSSGSLDAQHREDDADGWPVFSLGVTVSDVCEQVPVLDDNGEPVMKPVTRYESKEVETGEFVPVMEWKCPERWTR